LTGKPIATTTSPTPAPATSPIPSPTTQAEKQTTDELAGWKTYRNEEFGFEVKYPADWEVGDNTIRTKDFIVEEVSGFAIQSPEDVGRTYNVYNQTLSFGRFLKLKDFKASSSSELREEVDSVMTCIQESVNGAEILNLQNVSWVYCRELPEGFTNLHFYNINEKSGVVIKAQARSNQRIVSPEKLKTLTEKILSTFRFIDPTANWQTCVEPLFTIKYQTKLGGYWWIF